MFPAYVFALGLAAASAGPAPRSNDPPKFSDAYAASGYIVLPDVKLIEPFTANFDATLQKSRIDYYNKTMRTFQINAPYNGSPLGANLKIVWSPNRQTHIPSLVCYQSNATKEKPAKPQSVLPDLFNFKFVKYEDCQTGAPSDLVPKGNCSKWEFHKNRSSRSNDYFFWAKPGKSSFIPVRYRTVGIETLFGYHYDVYEIIYTSYVEGAQNATLFDPVKEAPEGKCVPFPEGQGASGRNLINPMLAFVDHDEAHLEEQFSHFKEKHGKAYKDDEEENFRKRNFRRNKRFIESMNRKNLGYKMTTNHLTDLHRDELRSLGGSKPAPAFNPNSAPLSAGPIPTVGLPSSVDWRDKGVVTSVKDQALCGSCWSFATAAHLESLYSLKFKKNITLSVQQLVDCSWNYGNSGCAGGEAFQSYLYIMDHGLALQEDYGDYLGIDGKCHDGSLMKPAISTLAAYVNVAGIENLKAALAFVGPVVVGMDAEHESLWFYSDGIYEEKNCKNTSLDMNHIVLAVGYGITSDNRPYWIIKNSWSTLWGDNGFLKIAMKENMCGVATAAAYAILP